MSVRKFENLSQFDIRLPTQGLNSQRTPKELVAIVHQTVKEHFTRAELRVLNQIFRNKCHLVTLSDDSYLDGQGIRLVFTEGTRGAISCLITDLDYLFIDQIRVVLST